MTRRLKFGWQLAVASLATTLSVAMLSCRAAAQQVPKTSGSELPPLDGEATARSAYVTAGIGLGELVHVEAGGFVLPRLTVDASAGWVFFNPLVGLGVTGYLFGDDTNGLTPEHSMLISGRLRINPTLSPLTLEGSGEVVGATAECYVGYAHHGASGFVYKASAGALFFAEDGFASGLNLLLSLGYAM